jgi:hypothetical protein
LHSKNLKKKIFLERENVACSFQSFCPKKASKTGKNREHDPTRPDDDKKCHFFTAEFSHFLITNFFHENGHQKFFQYFYTKMVTQKFIDVFALKWSPQTFCNVFILNSYQKFFQCFYTKM